MDYCCRCTQHSDRPTLTSEGTIGLGLAQCISHDGLLCQYVYTLAISLLSSGELLHVVINLLVRVATLSQFCCIDRSGAITVKTRPAVFLAASGFVVTILAINAYHTAGPLWFVL